MQREVIILQVLINNERLILLKAFLIKMAFLKSDPQVWRSQFSWSILTGPKIKHIKKGCQLFIFQLCKARHHRVWIRKIIKVSHFSIAFELFQQLGSIFLRQALDQRLNSFPLVLKQVFPLRSSFQRTCRLCSLRNFNSVSHLLYDFLLTCECECVCVCSMCVLYVAQLLFSYLQVKL